MPAKQNNTIHHANNVHVESSLRYNDDHLVVRQKGPERHHGEAEEDSSSFLLLRKRRLEDNDRLRGHPTTTNHNVKKAVRFQHEEDASSTTTTNSSDDDFERPPPKKKQKASPPLGAPSSPPSSLAISPSQALVLSIMKNSFGGSLQDDDCKQNRPSYLGSYQHSIDIYNQLWSASSSSSSSTLWHSDEVDPKWNTAATAANTPTMDDSSSTVKEQSFLQTEREILVQQYESHILGKTFRGVLRASSLLSPLLPLNKECDSNNGDGKSHHHVNDHLSAITMMESNNDRVGAADATKKDGKSTAVKIPFPQDLQPPQVFETMVKEDVIVAEPYKRFTTMNKGSVGSAAKTKLGDDYDDENANNNNKSSVTSFNAQTTTTTKLQSIPDSAMTTDDDAIDNDATNEGWTMYGQECFPMMVTSTTPTTTGSPQVRSSDKTTVDCIRDGWTVYCQECTPAILLARTDNDVPAETAKADNESSHRQPPCQPPSVNQTRNNCTNDDDSLMSSDYKTKAVVGCSSKDDDGHNVELQQQQQQQQAVTPKRTIIGEHSSGKKIATASYGDMTSNAPKDDGKRPNTTNDASSELSSVSMTPGPNEVRTLPSGNADIGDSKVSRIIKKPHPKSLSDYPTLTRGEVPTKSFNNPSRASYSEDSRKTVCDDGSGNSNMSCCDSGPTFLDELNQKWSAYMSNKATISYKPHQPESLANLPIVPKNSSVPYSTLDGKHLETENRLTPIQPFPDYFCYRCPVQSCQKQFLFHKSLKPVLNANGEVDDQEPWPFDLFGAQICRIRVHMAQAHAILPQYKWPPGFRPVELDHVRFHEYPVAGCFASFAFRSHKNPPLDTNGMLDDQVQWDPQYLQNNLREVRNHTRATHPSFSESRWPLQC